MNKQVNASTNAGSGKAPPAAAPGQEIKRPCPGPSVQAREAEAFRGLPANVSATTGFRSAVARYNRRA